MIGKLLGGLGRKVLLKAGYGKLDAALVKRWPVGWPALCKTAKGWKFLTGALLLSWPDMTQKVTDALQGAGYDPGYAVHYLAIGLVVLGLVDKFLKGWTMLAFGEYVVNETPSQPPTHGVDAVTHPPVISEEVDQERFLKLYNTLRNDFSMPWEKARSKALAIVIEEKNARKAGDEATVPPAA